METTQANDAEIRFENCGNVVRAAREEANVSIRELADRIDCDRGKLSKIENNKLQVTMATLQQIAEALGLPTEKLVFQCLELRFPKLRSTEAGSLLMPLLTKEES